MDCRRWVGVSIAICVLNLVAGCTKTYNPAAPTPGDQSSEVGVTSQDKQAGSEHTDQAGK